ncbi:hypothetical protein KAJ87_02835 [Candidatus Pacearchaeota archaeon]|nr:hypothetical protein [Candidatus Pacearchaeota archaeon]
MTRKFLKGLELYDPRKTLPEKIKPLIKPIIAFICIISIISATAYVTNYFSKEDPVIQKTYVEKEKSISEKQIQPILTDYSTIKQDLLKSPLVKDLPKNAKILLRFYNFNTGQRQWEKSFTIEQNNIQEKHINDEDIFIFVHSKYVDELKNSPLCDVLETADKNNDLGIELKISQVNLMWKYKNILKYKSCLGL